ncbi:MAG: PorP/SprF family type IX secretion system membrane protein, partial [Bacteroidetes bacterium]|nr:PorP/SprF family type IX secretion system membrane protein [Bacteroidota bacterium]
FRFSFAHRDQWGSVAIPYITTAVSAAIKVDSRNDKDTWGMGLFLISDDAGDLFLRTVISGISIAYGKKLPYDQTITAGFSGNITRKSFDQTILRAGNQYNGQQYDHTLPTGESFVTSELLFIDGSIGLLWSYQPSKHSSWYLGTAIHHFEEPRISYYLASQPIYRTWLLNGGGYTELDGRFALLPSFTIYYSGKLKQLNIGSLLRLALGKKYSSSLYLGSWYRWGDAVILAIRTDYKNLRFTMSYDLNTSSLSSISEYRGGKEVSLVFVGDFRENYGTKTAKCPKM